jgi:MYXO-CTERM domain-containing protein
VAGCGCAAGERDAHRTGLLVLITGMLGALRRRRGNERS